MIALECQIEEILARRFERNEQVMQFELGEETMSAGQPLTRVVEIGRHTFDILQVVNIQFGGGFWFWKYWNAYMRDRTVIKLNEQEKNQLRREQNAWQIAMQLQPMIKNVRNMPIDLPSQRKTA